MTSTPSANISFAVARVTPKPPARFSPLTTTKSSASVFCNPGSSAATTSRPGFPMMSPMNRIRIRSVLTQTARPATASLRETMIWRLAWELALFGLFLVVLLFWPAGTFDWWGGWAYIVQAEICGIAICTWLYVHDPALLKERLSGGFEKTQL